MCWIMESYEIVPEHEVAVFSEHDVGIRWTFGFQLLDEESGSETAKKTAKKIVKGVLGGGPGPN